MSTLIPNYFLFVVLSIMFGIMYKLFLSILINNGCGFFFFLFQVSWVRHRDIHLLTVGRYTYTGDQRFRSINQPPSEDWTLQIKYPQIRDSGIYECQISTTPHISQNIHLQVVGKYYIMSYNLKLKFEFHIKTNEIQIYF